jgi:hypothetical protein
MIMASDVPLLANKVPLQKIWLPCKIRKKPSQFGKLNIFIRAKMMIERKIQVDHSTIMRWVHQYSPEIE